MNQLDIQNFIKQHSDWEKLLKEKPYCILTSREKWNGLNLLMLKYNQIDSDFNIKLVRECRGLILDEDTLEPISYPFNKFGNKFGDGSEGTWVDDIKWSDHPYVLEKVDGSLCKVVKRNGHLLVSTNGTIFASKAQLNVMFECPLKNFEDLFWWTLDISLGLKHDDLLNLLDEDCTYMFEICTNYNRIVVPHPDPKIYFIGVRNNKTLQETYIYDHPLSKVFPMPRAYRFDSLDECIIAAKNLPWNDEGYVVTSRDFRRNKVKSINYLAAHHLANNHCLSYSRAIELVKANEIDEVCAYFDEFRPALEECKKRYNDLIDKCKDRWTKFLEVSKDLTTRKDKAQWIIKNFPVPGLAFSLLDNRVSSIDDFFKKMPIKNIVKLLGYKNDEQ